ncbi:MAG: hypothetical protein PHQ40_14745 [Anaerolineaceae bacterium]|nr:hypothetical protein [Anaerolineaceae bacterium]
MKPNSARTMLISLLALASLLFSGMAAQPALASPLAQDTVAPPPSNERPIVLIESYYMDVDSVSPGKDFNLFLTITNQGQNSATNILVTFTPGDLIPRETGGILSVGALDPGQKKTVKQPMTINTAITGGGISSVVANTNYSDAETNASYTAAFNIALHVNYRSYAPAAPTSTPTAINVVKPQLAISGYKTDVDPLQPGQPFDLTLEVRNLGNADAKSVTMITGGGTGASGGASGTPEPGGVSGASGEFTNFAPLKSSNIHFIGDVKTGQVLSIDQSLIVNTTTQPGAYSLKFSFVYTDSHGVRFTDDQVITLLVFQLPLVEITFYREAGPFFAGQPGPLPLQITNLSRKQTVLGNLKATVKSGGTISNNTTLVGAMDPGGYFTLDAMLLPDAPGPLDIDITVSYTDDFNQPQSIHQSLQVTVQEQMAPPEGTGGPGVPGGKPGEFVNPGSNIPSAPETFMQKVVRFLKGMIGLDSGQSQPATNPGMPIEGGAPGNGMNGGSSKPIIIPAPPMKGG